MPYLKDLGWMKEYQSFQAEERKVLLALSNDRFEWRTAERLVSVTGLSLSEVDKALGQLISRGTCRPSMSKQKNIIYGLTERVG